MQSSVLRDSAAGITLAAISFILVFSAFPVPVANAATQPLFSMTVLAPTSNPVRRQWAAIITNSFQSVNIQANLVYIPFSTVNSRIFGVQAPMATYDKGGFDALFVGFGGGTVLPDYGTNNVVNYRSDGYTPTGNNYYGYKNATYDKLADQYANAFNQTSRAPLLKQMETIAAQDRPVLILQYTPLTTVFANNILPWNQQKSYSEATTGLDTQHFKVPTQNFTLNVAETGDINNVDELPTGTSNSLYDRYLYGPVTASLEELDVRNLQYFNALATSINSSADHLSWTVSFKPHTFQDGVPVTADDYLFYYLATLRGDAASVNLGTFQTILGLNVQLTFSNGTSDYITNGTYTHGTAPSGFKANSVFKSTSATSFSFTMPAAYSFTDPVITGVNALPMHIFEKVPAGQWVSSFLSKVTNTPTTVTWDKARYGGNGSYAYVYGPVGDGAYRYKGYDSTANVGTLTRYDGYWNATGLKSIGMFGVQTEHVFFIGGKDAAIAAFKNGQVNMLDGQYTFITDDNTLLSSLGAVPITSVDPSSGWQELGLNMNHPVFGTGTGTPLGQKDPTKATQAARLVRKAMSYLIPRQDIINNLLQGLGQPGITQFCTCFSWGMPAGLQADPYDANAAKGFLAAAGYNTGVAPPSTGGNITLPTAPNVTGITVNGTKVNINVKVPSFLLGNTLTLTGKFPVDPELSLSSGGFAVVLQQASGTTNLNNCTAWTPVQFALTTPGTGSYSVSYAPTANGTFSYRTLFTGIPGNAVEKGSLGSADLIQAQLWNNPKLSDTCGKASAKGTALNATAPAFGPTTQLTVGSLGDVVNSLAQGVSQSFQASTTQINTALQTVNKNIAALTNSVNQLSSSTQAALNKIQSGTPTGTTTNSTVTTQLNNLNGQVSTLTTVSYAALGVAIVLGLIAIVLSMRRRTV